MIHVCGTASPLLDACTAMEDVRWLERVLVGKAKKKSILDEDGFIRAIVAEAAALREEVAGSANTPEFRKGLRSFIATNWPQVSAKERDEAITAAANLISGMPSRFMPGVELVLDQHGQRAINSTHRALGNKYRRLTVDPTFGRKNERAVETLKTTTSMFFKPEYERRARGFRKTAQRVITEGLESGKGRREISRDLAGAFQNAALPQGYWETVAAVHVNRARSFSSLATYAEAEVSQFEFVAIDDTRTTDICRGLNGTVFSVESALKTFASLEDAKSLDQVKAASPFLVQRDGGVYTPEGEKVIGPRGGMSMTPAQLSARGIAAPPLHYRCRSTIVPVF